MMILRLFLKGVFPVLILICSDLFAQTNLHSNSKKVSIFSPQKTNPRVIFGVEKLSKSLVDAGYTVNKIHRHTTSSTGSLIIVTTAGDKLTEKIFRLYKISESKKAGSEGFTISTKKIL